MSFGSGQELGCADSKADLSKLDNKLLSSKFGSRQI